MVAIEEDNFALIDAIAGDDERRIEGWRLSEARGVREFETGKHVIVDLTGNGEIL